MKKNIQYRIVLIFIILTSIVNELDAQNISFGADGKDKISHESTGYSAAHPVDIPDSTGVFMYTSDGIKAIRLYGSFRMLVNLDNKQQFQAYEIDAPTMPTGVDDFTNINANWTINMSRLGVDFLVGLKSSDSSAVLIRFEVDWKGTNEAFRIRHLFARSQHFIIGKTWTSFNSLEFLPLTVEGHMTGATSGVRLPQIRYYNKSGNWKYQIGLEYLATDLLKPDYVEAIGRVSWPNLASKFIYEGSWGKTGAAILLKPNRIQFEGDVKRVQNLFGYGANINALFNVGKMSKIKLSGYGGVGISSYIVDFSYVDSESVYNPATEDFESSEHFGALASYEHYWSKNKVFSSSFAVGYNNVTNKSYQEDLAFQSSYKAMANLFYKPINHYKGLNIGVEFLYVNRYNKNESLNVAYRPALLLYYDF